MRKLLALWCCGTAVALLAQDAVQTDPKHFKVEYQDVKTRVVREILEPAAAAGRIVGTRRLDAVRPGCEHLGRERLGVIPLHLRDPGADGVSVAATPSAVTSSAAGAASVPTP